ncbi:MAG TPA: ABC transporter permease [Puia sp.]|uniref:ABC transporter permease n=1 Tax=Puia sp. TaxID=2045100 RepID=UPI002C728F1B|nr:ABC transporter permease [Puia sp.]HVU98132.1 ABC transporter permease [Puia sp.]
MSMLHSYLRFAMRNLAKNKIYSLINIAGLAVGLAVFGMMALYIADELSYDRDLTTADRVYRVVHSGQWAGGHFNMAQTPPAFGPALVKEDPGIEAATRINAEGGGTIINGDKKLDVADIFFADSSALTVFPFPFLAGDAESALTAPNSIVLTKTLAERLFGNADEALHKTLTIRGDGPKEVTGVIEDRPENSHLRFSALLSMKETANEWKNSYDYTYVLLKKGVNIRSVEARIPGFCDRHIKPQLGKGASYRMQLQSLPSIHLHSHLDYELGRNGDIRYIYLFAAVALLVLGIAVINYINLATARASIRMKEIGVRKVIGGSRGQLVTLFLTESIFFALLSAAIAAILAYLALPAFDQLSGKALVLFQFGMWRTMGILAAAAMLIGLLGGLYPALFLSGFHTIPALKGEVGDVSTTVLFRKSLVTFQFVITIFLIAGSAMIYLQLRFMQGRDLGFNKNQVLTFHLPNPEVRKHIDDLKTQLLRDPSIEAVAAAGNPIGNNDIGDRAMWWEENGALQSEAMKVKMYYVDADYLPTLQIGLAAGRNFSAATPTDVLGSVLVNETLVKKMGWKDAIGKRAKLGTDDSGRVLMASVIGVVKDFNIYSLQHTIEPLVLRMPPVWKEEDNLCVRLQKGHIPQGLKHIAEVYGRMDPATTLDFHFLDDNFSRQYAAERKQGSILLVFTVLAIFIACLGLLGLVTFSVGQRTKEIGIRKVLGASVGGIVLLVSKDLIKPVALAIVISTPLAWWAMHKWLEGFAYRVNIGIWIFIAAGLLAAAIAMLTVGLRAMRAAKMNPTGALRND